MDRRVPDRGLAVWLVPLVVGVVLARCGGEAPASPVQPSLSMTPAATGSVEPEPTTGQTAAPSFAPSSGSGLSTARASTAPSPPASPTPPSPSAAPTSSPARTHSPTVDPTLAACVPPEVYSVVGGDTLSEIAERFAVTVESLLAANPQIIDGGLIHVGEEIAISPIDIGTLGGLHGGAEDINNLGQAVGWANTATSSYGHAFLWEDWVMRDLGTLGGDGSWAMAINDRGQVAGYSLTSSAGSGTLGPMHAFLWEDGVMTDLGSLGGEEMTPLDINEREQVVGYGETATGERHAFMWQDRVLTDLGTLGGSESQAFAINERGQVVGQSLTGSSTHAFLWHDGVMTDIGAFGWWGAWATGINDEAQMALSLSEPSGASHAAWADGGTVTDLGGLEGATRFASDLNNRGQAVGWDQIGMEGGHRAFVWQDGTTSGLTALDAFITEAHAINDCGLVVGASAPTWGQYRPVLWTTPGLWP